MALRTVLAVILTLALLLAPLAIGAQPARRIPQVGLLLVGPAAPQIVRFITEPFQDLGWVDGQNITLLYRWAVEGQEQERLLTELLQRHVDLLFVGGTPAALAARKATREIPIVFHGVGDPVGAGLVASLAHPGGNVTGVTDIFGELTAKHVELLKEAVPLVSRVAYLWDTTFVDGPRRLAVAQAAAQRLGVRLVPVGVRGAADLEGGFAEMARAQVGGLVVQPGPFTFARREVISALAAKSRLPAIFGWSTAGALLSYGPHRPDVYRRAVALADRVLKRGPPRGSSGGATHQAHLDRESQDCQGAGPHDPPAVLARADEVIQ
jgi:putative ABC transport system substrate-binding protein